MLGVRLRGFPAWFAARTYHLAMMPGMARRVRLGDRLDGRARLRARLGRARAARASAGARATTSTTRRGPARRPADERPVVPRGPRERSRGDVRARRARVDQSRADRGLIGRGTRRRRDEQLRDALGARAAAARVHDRADGSCFLVCEDGDELVGYARVARFGGDGRDDRAVGRARRTPGRGVEPRPARALLAGVAHARARPAGRGGRARPRDLTLYTEFGVMPVAGHWHMRHRVRPSTWSAAPRRPTRPSRPCTCSRPTARSRSGSGSSRPRSAHERPPLHEFFGRTRTCLATVDDAGDATGALLGQRPTATSARRSGQNAERPDPGGARGARPGGEDAGAGEPRRLLHHRRRGGCCDRLRRLGFRVYWPSWVMCSVPLPGLDRYLADAPRQIALAASLDIGDMGQAISDAAASCWPSWFWSSRPSSSSRS